MLGKLYADASRAERVHDLMTRLDRDVFAGSPGLAGLPEGGDRPLLVERRGPYAMVIECGPFAMPDVIRLDMRTALASLDSAS